MKLTLRRIGLLQAAGLTLYVCFFAVAVWQFEMWLAPQHIQPQPVLGITIFLLAFIISAITCSSLVLAYPAVLFFGNKKEVAVKIILWTLFWLIIFFLAFLIISFVVLLKFSS